jgi:hypothetical protein
MDPPTSGGERLLSACITLAILPDLGKPILDICFGSPVAAFARVAMPEAAMHEENGSTGRKNEVWFPGQVEAVQSISEASLVQE